MAEKAALLMQELQGSSETLGGGLLEPPKAIGRAATHPLVHFLEPPQLAKFSLHV